jgi:hypothetical protein
MDSSNTLDTKEFINKLLSPNNQNFLNKLSNNAKEDLEKISKAGNPSDQSTSFKSFIEKEKAILDKDKGALETTKESYKLLSESYSKSSAETVVKDLEAKKEDLRKKFQTSKDSLSLSGANKESAKHMIDAINKAIDNPLDLRAMQSLKDKAELHKSTSKGLIGLITGKSNFHDGLESLNKAIDEHIKSPAEPMNRRANLKRAFNGKGLIQKKAIDEHLKSPTEPMKIGKTLILEVSRLKLKDIYNTQPGEKTQACRRKPIKLGNGTIQGH